MTAREELVGELHFPSGKPQNVKFFHKKRPQLTKAEQAAGIKWIDNRYEFGDIRRYGAIDDDLTDNSVAFQAAADVGLIIIPETSSKWALEFSVSINNSCECVSFGRDSTIRQKSWGVPVFEIRAANVSFPGHIYLETTETRSTFDSTALTASNNSSTVKTEASTDPKAAGSAIYGRTFDNVHFGHLETKGFIAGILFASGNNWSINQLTVEDVDFGTFGAPGDGCQIGQVNAIDILRSQGVDEHAVYFPGTATAIGNGLTIGEITCAAVQTGSHIVSLKYQKNFSIGSIVGHTDVASPITLLESTGSIGIIDVAGTKAPTNDASGSNILVQSNSDVRIGSIYLDSYMNDDVASNAAINVTTSAIARIEKLVLVMKDADDPGKGLRSSASAYVTAADITYDFTTSAEYAFLATGSGFIAIRTPPKLTGNDHLLRVESPATYELVYDPDLIDQLAEDTIVSTSGTYNTKFVGGGTFVVSGVNNDATPQVRHTNRLKIDYNGVVTITNFDSGSAGQDLFVWFNHTSTVTVDFTGTNLKGNAGLDWTPAQGDILHAVFDGTDWRCDVVDCIGSNNETYTESNVTTDRTYDANSTTLDEVADVLGTLIDDLRNKGLVD